MSGDSGTFKLNLWILTSKPMTWIAFTFLLCKFILAVSGIVIVIGLEGGATSGCSSIWPYSFISVVILCLNVIVGIRNQILKYGGSMTLEQFNDYLVAQYNKYTKWSIYVLLAFIIWGIIILAKISDSCKNYYIDNYYTLWVYFIVLFSFYVTDLVSGIAMAIYYFCTHPEELTTK